LALGSLGAGGALLAVTLPATAAPAMASDSTTLCTFDDTRLTEISGLTHSLSHEDVLWMHNDSGDGPRLYALNAATCDVIATVRITGVKAIDFEAIGSGVDERGRSVLWVADIGDNTSERKGVTLHRIVEPSDLRDQKVTADSYSVRYDSPADAEAIIVGDDALWIVTKGLASGSVLRFPLPLVDKARAESVGTEEGLVTDAAIAPDGEHYVVRDYTEARIYAGPPPGTLIARLPLPEQVQGEAITWAPDGTGLDIASESDNRIIRVALPAEISVTPKPSDAPTENGMSVSPAPSSTEVPPESPAPETPPASQPNADDSDEAAPTSASSVLDPAEQLGSLSLLAIAISGGVFLIATIAVVAVIWVKDRRTA